MRYRLPVLIAAALCYVVSPAHADTFFWTDERGTTHFTDDLGKVPAKFRRQIRPDEQPPPPQASPEPTAREQAPTPTKNKIAGTADPVNSDVAPFQKGLTEREAAIDDIRNKLVDLVAKLNSSRQPVDERKQLLAEHQVLSDRFNQMRAEYNEYVEQIRQAGFQVNIQQ